jgi:hypothetical protein
MTEHMGICVELWLVGADARSIWLLDGDAWRSDRVDADQFIQNEIELLAWHHAPDTALAVTHSTSWRQDRSGVVLTYIAIGAVGEYVQDQWPHALPITTELLDEVKRPFTHAANEAPLPRDIDVLIHAVRHLRFLRDTDRPTSDAMNEHWQRHLQEFEPALSRMYTEPHEAS